MLLKNQELFKAQLEIPTYFISKLALTDFRSYKKISIDTNDSNVALIGPNGSGKTNILEAISLLSPGRGLRGGKNEEIVRDKIKSGWAVTAKINLSYPKTENVVGTGTISEKTNESFLRRTVKINSEKKSISSLSEVANISWLTPQMDRIFQAEPNYRRRFIDKLVLSYDQLHAKRVMLYEKTIRERNKILGLGKYSEEWLDAIEKSIVEVGVAIVSSRKEVVQLLEKNIKENDSLFPKAILKMNCIIEDMLSCMPSIDAELFFANELKKNRKFDAESGRTSVGPHKSDLIVIHEKKNIPAGQCSTGEQKILLISIILADAKVSIDYHGGAPILLLDEIGAHLDSSHIRVLFEEFKRMNSQIWLTGTDTTTLDKVLSDFQIFKVINSEVIPL